MECNLGQALIANSLYEAHYYDWSLHSFKVKIFCITLFSFLVGRRLDAVIIDALIKK